MNVMHMNWLGNLARTAAGYIGSFVCIVIVSVVALPAGDARADYDEAKVWFESQSSKTRVELQDDLFWSGDYFGRIDGKFGRETYAALVSYQRRKNAPPTGVLDTAQVANLHREAQRIRDLVRRFSRQDGQLARTEVRSSPYPTSSPASHWLLILP